MNTIPKYVAVAGNIGVGKSSIVEFLCKILSYTPIFEPHQGNPYLADFYQDMKHWSFHSQIYFLARKFRLQLDAQSKGIPIILDRTIYEDAEIFARSHYENGLMDERDFSTYWSFYESIKQALTPPDLLIYLTADVKVIQKRIRHRNRSYEKNIPLNYLKNLDKLYKGWIKNYNLSPVIELDTSRLDYLTDMLDREEVLAKIKVATRGRYSF